MTIFCKQSPVGGTNLVGTFAYLSLQMKRLRCKILGQLCREIFIVGSFIKPISQNLIAALAQTQISVTNKNHTDGIHLDTALKVSV